MSIFDKMDILVDDFFKDVDETIDNLKSKKEHNEGQITSQQEQEWHEKNIEDGWY